MPATLESAVLHERIAGADAVAIIKVGRHLDRVRRVLGDLGLLEKAHYIERATMTNERAQPLAEVAADTVPYFSMIVVHRRGRASNL